MNAFTALTVSVLASATLTSGLATAAPEIAVETPVVYLVLTIEGDECECVATTGSALGHNDTTIECAAGTAGSLFVWTTSRTNGPCDKDGPGGTCSTQEGSLCKATVKARLMWPTPAACCQTAGMTGPQIGTNENPCQQAPHGAPVPDQVWNLTAPCSSGADSLSNGTPPFVVYCGVGCGGAKIADFAPRLDCAKCTVQTAGTF